MKELSPEQRDPTEPLRPRWPWGLRILFGVFLLWVLLGWLRFIQVLLERSLILEILQPGVFYYLVIAGLIWGLAGLPVLWALLKRSAWWQKAVWVGAVIYPLVYWIERLFLWRDPFARRNWPFMLAMTLLWFALVTWTTRSRQARRYFEVDVDQEG